MKHILTGLLLAVFTLACNHQKTGQKIEQELTKELADAIIAKYELEEGSFARLTADDANSNSGIRPTPVSVEEFEALVKNLSEYQKSKEGKLAKKMNDFAIKNEK